MTSLGLVPASIVFSLHKIQLHPLNQTTYMPPFYNLHSIAICKTKNSLTTFHYNTHLHENVNNRTRGVAFEWHAKKQVRTGYKLSDFIPVHSEPSDPLFTWKSTFEGIRGDARTLDRNRLSNHPVQCSTIVSNKEQTEKTKPSI